MMMMHKCARGMGSLLQVRKGTVLPRFGPKILEHLLPSNFFCNGSTSPPFLGSTKPGSKIIQLNPPVTRRGYTGESLVPSFGDKSKKSRGVKPGKRIKVAEQGKVYGNIRLNILADAHMLCLMLYSLRSFKSKSSNSTPKNCNDFFLH